VFSPLQLKIKLLLNPCGGKKEGTPAPAKNYLQPTTTTNGVNTSRAGYAISYSFGFRVDQREYSEPTRDSKLFSLHYHARIYCFRECYYHHSNCSVK
jgi:hypothetical protein